MINEEKNHLTDASLADGGSQEQTLTPKTFSSDQEYVDYIRELIRSNTSPKAWLSYDMLTALLEKNAVAEHFIQMGYASLEDFLRDPRYKMLWRVDQQENAPFLIRHSYAKEIQEYVHAVSSAIKKLYIENSRTPITLVTLSTYIKDLNLPISYVQMGYPSFEVFLLDKRFSEMWIATKTPDFSITLQPVVSDGRQLFLDRTYHVVSKYFARHPQKPTKQQLIRFFSNGVAGKLYSRYGFESLEELANDPVFAQLVSEDPSGDFGNRKPLDKTLFTPSYKAPQYEDTAANDLIELVKKAYANLLETPEWISLTEVAARIPDVKALVKKTGNKSLSKFIQNNANKFPLEYSYTDSSCPAFQIRFFEMPDVPKTPDFNLMDDSEERFVNELKDVVRMLQKYDEWVLLAVLGQHIRLMKERLTAFGYASIGHFIKQNASRYGWKYRCIDNLPSKFAIHLLEEEPKRPIDRKSPTQQRQRTNPDKKDLRQPLLEPIYCYGVSIEDSTLFQIASLAESEPWQKGDQKPYAILDYYLRATLSRSATDYTLIQLSEGYLFNTALVTPEGDEIVAVVKELKTESGALKLTLTEAKIIDDTLTDEIGFRPRIPRYFNFSGRVPLEVYICKPSRMLPSYQYETLKGDAKSLFDEEDLLLSIENSWLRLNRQIRMAINIYSVEHNEMHLLLPLYKDEVCERPVASLELAWRSGYYEGIAVHSLATSYMLARPIARPVASIIHPDL